MMIIIGTGHIFNVAEPISFIIKNCWPEAVLVELDERRYSALISPKTEKADVSKSFRKAAEYQQKMSEKNGVDYGGDMLSTISSARLIGAEIICIDRDTEQVLKELEDEMTFRENIRHIFFNFRDNHFPRRRIDDVRKGFADKEREYTYKMRRRFPVFYRKMIDERNSYMVDRIREASERFDKIVIVVGDAHVEGICDALADPSIKKIRLVDLLDEGRMSNIRNEIWGGKLTGGPKNEG